MIGFTVLPHPDDPVTLLVHPDEVATRSGLTAEAVIDRARGAGISLVSAWGQSNLLPLADAARLAEAITDDVTRYSAANDARLTFREVVKVEKALRRLEVQRRERDERKDRVKQALDHEAERLRLRREGVVVESTDPRAERRLPAPDDEPEFDAFLKEQAI